MLTTIYCETDDFYKLFKEKWEKKLISPKKSRNRHSRLSIPEVMTIVINFHLSNYRNFKHYYIDHVKKHMKNEFPDLVSYSRFC